MDAQPGAPEHDDQPAQPPAVAPVAGGAHDGDDLLDGRRIGRVAHALVARRAAGVEPGHRRRRAAATGGIEQQLGHDPSSGSETSREHRGRVIGPEDIALDAQRESRFASVALAAAALSGPPDLPRCDSEGA